ncbi:MAG: MbnP family protein, partial [Bacteroidia bacterium]
YKNTFNQAYSITKFKYYIGNICLKDVDGKEFKSKDYFLINEDEDDSKQLILQNIPSGNYVSIHFIIGVDSLHNCSGLQTDALDPVNGMFWAWNTGYIFLKLEGNSSFSKSPANIFEFHIGGYKQPTNSIRTINLKLNNPLNIAAKTSVIDIKVNAAEVLKTPTAIDFSVLSSVTTPQSAPTIANNYADMFSILQVKNEN